MLWLLWACDFSAPDDVLQVSEDTGDSHIAEEDTSSQWQEDTGSEAPEDIDNEGFTSDEGDCDDSDPTIYPGAEDLCDGEDEDCDDEIDEDADSEDPYEPNDESAWSLGSINTDKAISLQAALHNNTDVDRFSFDFDEPSLSLDFALTVTLSGIPDEAQYRLYVTDGDDETLYDNTSDQPMQISIDDEWFDDQSGNYGIEISAIEGADCSRRYLLSITLE